MFSYVHRHVVHYVFVIILFNCLQTFSKETFSVIDSIDENGNIIVTKKYSAIDFGHDFYVDEILQEMEDMDEWPGMIDQPFMEQSGEKCLDTCGASESSLSQVPEAGDNDEYYQPITQVGQTTMQNKVEILDNSTSKKTIHDDVMASTASVSSAGPASTNEVTEMIQGGNTEQVLASLTKIANFPEVSLDYSDDGEEDNNIVYVVQKRFPGKEESSLDKMDSTVDETLAKSVEEAMTDSVSDILAPVKGERQARQFYGFDLGSAINTSLAFTLPLFSFTLPGSGDVTPDGLDSNVQGTMAFLSLFLLGGLGLAIYVNLLSANTTFDARSFDAELSRQELLLEDTYEPLAKAVSSAFLELSEALHLPRCTQLAACKAHQRTKEYGVMGLPFTDRAPMRPEAPSEDLSPLEAAVRVGAEGGNCAWEFPCIMDPLQLMENVIDLLAGTLTMSWG